MKQGEATSPPDFAYIFGNNITLSDNTKASIFSVKKMPKGKLAFIFTEGIGLTNRSAFENLGLEPV